MYLFLLVVVRVTGRRTLGEMNTFDFVLVLIMSEAAQNAMVGDDFSLTNAALVILTLVGLDIALSIVKCRWGWIDRWIDGVPTILVDHGHPLVPTMRRARVETDDILEAARKLQGLERLDQIKYAILERSGEITVIPKA
jgi:uncharacterized membrane protein YcaP (DUF421 family)